MYKHYEKILSELKQNDLLFDFNDDKKILSDGYSKLCNEVWDFDKIINLKLVFLINGTKYYIKDFFVKYNDFNEVFNIILSKNNSKYSVYQIIEELDYFKENNNNIIISILGENGKITELNDINNYVISVETL